MILILSICEDTTWEESFAVIFFNVRNAVMTGLSSLVIDGNAALHMHINLFKIHAMPMYSF